MFKNVDSGDWVVIFIIVALLTFCIALSYLEIDSSRNEEVTKMVKEGYTPIEAGCALGTVEKEICSKLVEGRRK